MASFFTFVLSLSLLLLSSVYGFHETDGGSLYHRDDAVATALREVGRALQCLGDTTQDGLQAIQENLQKQNTGMIQQVKDDVNSLKRENEALQRVISLTQETMALKIQLLDNSNKMDETIQENMNLKKEIEKYKNGAERDQEIAILKTELNNKDKMVVTLTQENSDLKTERGIKDQNVVKLNEEVLKLKTELADNKRTVEQLSQQITIVNEQLTNSNLTVEQLSQQITIVNEQLTNSNLTVQDMENSLGQCQKRVQELEGQVEKLNNTDQEHVTKKRECEKHEHLDKIKQVVQAFINSRDWNTLKGGLHDVLDNNTVEYKQLEYASAPWHTGYYGCTQLVALLLCAGLPLNSDSIGYDMLVGAARGSRVEMVKLLLERGADVNGGSSYYGTPLMAATAMGHLELVKYLVQAGADTTARDQYGYTALMHATNSRLSAIAQYLQQLPH